MVLPTGNDAKQLGSGGFGGGASLAATLEVSRLTFSGDVGVHAGPNPNLANLDGGAQLRMGLGAGLLATETIGINLEWWVRSSLKAATVPGTKSPSELALSVRGRTAPGFHWLGGVSFGTSSGVGAAAWRVFVGAGWGKIKDDEPVGPSDRDGDGLIDDEDRCPDEPEVVNDYKDEDGCPDAMASAKLLVTSYDEPIADLTVMVTGVGISKKFTSESEPITVEGLIPGAYDIRSLSPDYEGNMQVGVRDGSNEIVLEVYPAAPANLTVLASDENGTPIPSAELTVAPPGGGEGIGATLSGGEAEVPVPAGTYTLFVQAEGYGIHRSDFTVSSREARTLEVVLKGAKVKVGVEKLEILEKVFFETNSDIIKQESFGLLDEVSAILLKNPQLKLVEVAGHTDSEGETSYNQGLSERRAASVTRYLVEKGVAERKLKAVGYGETKPLDTNETDAGRSKNRRVEFVILKQDD